MRSRLGLGAAGLQPAGRALTTPTATPSFAAAWRSAKPAREYHVLLRRGVASSRWEGPEQGQPSPHNAQVEGANRRPYVAIVRQLHAHVVVGRLGERDGHDPYVRRERVSR